MVRNTRRTTHPYQHVPVRRGIAGYRGVEADALEDPPIVTPDPPVLSAAGAEGEVPTATGDPAQPWTPEEGSEATIFYSEDDPGAVGAGAIWVRPENDIHEPALAILVRNALDDGWSAPVRAGFSEFGATSAAVHATDQAVNLTAIAANEDQSLVVIGGDGPMLISSPVSGTADRRVLLSPVGLHIGPAGEMNPIDAPVVVSGSADPSAAAGVAAPQGSLYLRTSGQHWAKTGAGDTDWTQLATV